MEISSPLVERVSLVSLGLVNVFASVKPLTFLLVSEHLVGLSTRGTSVK